MVANERHHRQQDRPTRGLQPPHAALVRGLVRGSDPGAGRGLAADRLRRQHADLRPDRLRQDAQRLPVGYRLARAAVRQSSGRGEDRLRLAAQGALLRRRAQPARAVAGDRRRRRGRPAHRRHAAEGAPGDEAHPARHPDHDPGVALSDDHLAGARDPHRGRGRDRRRDPRGRPIEARRPPGADPRAALASGPDLGDSGTPGGEAEGVAGRDVQRIGLSATQRPAGADRPVPGRAEARMRDRQRRRPQGSRPADRRPGRGHDGTRGRRERRARERRATAR